VRAASGTAWVPGSKPFRFTEYGCAALDKGANQPNKFLDPKSSESALPRASNGRRDDLMQVAYLRAMWEYWTDPVNNPLSLATGQSMLDMARSHVWTWDARPFPAFPSLDSIWSDADNYTHGHWLSGRSSSQPLARVIAEICDRAKIAVYDVSEAHGIVRGFSVNEIGSARSALQVLSLAHGLEIIERDGVLKAWRLPADFDGVTPCPAAANADHRLQYLDYEGAVSGDRGSVARWDAGTAEWEEVEPDRIAVCFVGRRLNGRYALTHCDADSWELRRGA